MLSEISVLTKLNLCNLYGLNVYKNNKDKKAKKTYIALFVVMLFLVCILSGYIGLLVYGYIRIGLGDVISAYLIMLASLIILLIGIFKTGPVLFERKGYDILCSLPVSTKSIVISRFIKMYVENMVLVLVVMVPGTLVYGFLLKLGLSFYLVSTFVILFLPFGPMTISVIAGSCFTAISSRTKHKSIVGAILPIMVVIVTMAFVGKFSITEGQLTPEMLVDLSGVVTKIIAAIYPPAIWLGDMMMGIGTIRAVLFIAGTFIAFGIVVHVIGSHLKGICQTLYGTTAKHDYVMGNQEQNKIVVALLKRELKRYFASTVYLSNTIIGPILSVIFAGGMIITDIDEAVLTIPLKIDIDGVIPLIIGTIFCIMNTTSTSISMEGKEWWIMKNLPLTTKQILDAKLLMNLAVFGPFYVVADILTIIALRPSGLELLWVIIIPAVLIMFSCTWGIFINIKFPVFNWENETSIVKQSMSSLIGGLCSALVGIVLIILLLVLPYEVAWIVKTIAIVSLLAVTMIMYNKNNKVRLEVL